MRWVWLFLAAFAAVAAAVFAVGDDHVRSAAMWAMAAFCKACEIDERMKAGGGRTLRPEEDYDAAVERMMRAQRSNEHGASR